MQGEARIEVIDDIVVARVRGEPTEAILRACQEQVLSLLAEAGGGKVLYDALEMQAPPVDMPWLQRELDENLGALRLRRAIVVPNSKLAYLARLAFGDGDYRVFYDDMSAAIAWLNEGGTMPAADAAGAE